MGPCLARHSRRGLSFSVEKPGSASSEASFMTEKRKPEAATGRRRSVRGQRLRPQGQSKNSRDQKDVRNEFVIEIAGTTSEKLAKPTLPERLRLRSQSRSSEKDNHRPCEKTATKKNRKKSRTFKNNNQVFQSKMENSRRAKSGTISSMSLYV